MKNKLITIYEYIGLVILYSTIYLPITIVLAVSLGLSVVSLGLKMLSGIVTTFSQVALWPSNLALPGYWKPLELHRKRTRAWRGAHIPDFVNEEPHDLYACGSGRKFKNCHGQKFSR